MYALSATFSIDLMSMNTAHIFHFTIHRFKLTLLLGKNRFYLVSDHHVIGNCLMTKILKVVNNQQWFLLLLSDGVNLDIESKCYLLCKQKMLSNFICITFAIKEW